MKKIGFERRYVSCQFNNLKACCLPLECPDLTSPVPTRVPSRGSSQSNIWKNTLIQMRGKRKKKSLENFVKMNMKSEKLVICCSYQSISRNFRFLKYFHKFYAWKIFRENYSYKVDFTENLQISFFIIYVLLKSSFTNFCTWITQRSHNFTNSNQFSFYIFQLIGIGKP